MLKKLNVEKQISHKYYLNRNCTIILLLSFLVLILNSVNATDRAQRRLVLGFGADRSGAGRGGQAHTVNTEGQAQWTRINYGPLARVAGQAGCVPGGKGEMEWSHVTQEPSSAELEARVKMRGRRGKVSRGLSEDPAIRPATHQHCR
jgi:hypothetical protein